MGSKFLMMHRPADESCTVLLLLEVLCCCFICSAAYCAVLLLDVMVTLLLNVLPLLHAACCRCAFCAYEWLLLNANGVSSIQGGGNNRRLQQLLPIISSSNRQLRATKPSAASPFSWYPSTDSGASSICAVRGCVLTLKHEA
jgi:hypothetical protein